MSNVPYLWIDFADIYSTDCSNLQSTVQITIYFLPGKRLPRFQHVGGDGCVILGDCGMGCKFPPPPPPPINHDSSLIYILIDWYFNRCYIDLLHLTLILLGCSRKRCRRNWVVLGKRPISAFFTYICDTFVIFGELHILYGHIIYQIGGNWTRNKIINKFNIIYLHFNHFVHF